MRKVTKLNEGWEFRRTATCGDAAEGAESLTWERVELPHSAVVTDVNGRGHWQGVCEYRRVLEGGLPGPGWKRVLWVGGAMHSCRAYVDGKACGSHLGGYLSFELDLTEQLREPGRHELVLELDNRNAPDIPPGKPLEDLDFCWFGGLYRGVALREYPPVHITDELTAGKVAGGGVFFRTERADTELARCVVEVDVAGAGAAGHRVRVRLEREGVPVASSEVLLQGPGGAGVALEWGKPELWSPAKPALHSLVVEVVDEAGVPVDRREQRVGVRRLSFSRSGGLSINGERLRLRGTNRHQEYPYLGYAIGGAADRRDARRIKEAGFDYVRLSHYPQSPAFLDACDELGIVVMNAIPGWQFIGGGAFQEACEKVGRDLVRRDRNHACVVLWELSLNETQMDAAFMERMHRAGHEEYPGDQLFTCGWMNAFDVYIHARQHGGIHSFEDGDRAHVVSEYGDWEFYAANEGFDQKTGAGVHAAWSNSRHFRAGGETGLLQQAANFTLALNDTLSSPAVLDGQWCMFDYTRGYHPLRAACGVSDIFRLPKYAWHFYRSQRDPEEGGAGWTGGAMVFVASHWLPTSSRRVTVYSNCEEVELRLNGLKVSRERPSVTVHSQYLPHPPFVFEVPRWEAGELRAVAYVGGLAVAEHKVATPDTPVALRLEVDTQGIAPGALGRDAVFVHARFVDRSGTLCVEETGRVWFRVKGAELPGGSVVDAEAGVASLLLVIPEGFSGLEIEAKCGELHAELKL